jgi:hypothetical protein
MSTTPNVSDGSTGFAIWHPATAGGKNIRTNLKNVPATHHSRTKPAAGQFKPGRIVTDYELVDANGNKIKAMDAGSQVVLEVGYNQDDLRRAGNDAGNLVLTYWDEASGTWVRFTVKDHGFQLVTDTHKYPGFLGYGRVDKNVPIDPPTGWSP